MGTLISYYGGISVRFGLLSFFLGLLTDRNADIPTRVTKAGAAMTIPFGVVLIGAAIDPSALANFKDLPSPTFAGRARFFSCRRLFIGIWSTFSPR